MLLSNRRWHPSAEFVESALIFFYGSTNVFLEHLGGWGGEWNAQDLEHMSIAVLFIGGGLVSRCPHDDRIVGILMPLLGWTETRVLNQVPVWNARRVVSR